MKPILLPYKESIVDLYKNQQKSIKEISKIYNCYEQPIRNLLKNEDFYRKRPNQGNIRYFQNIDTSLKAYFLGFIAADGCLQKFTPSSKGLSITLDIKDKCILDKLKEEIGNEHTIKVWSRKQTNSDTISTYCRFTLANNFLYYDLLNLGIIERKSLAIKNIIKNVPLEFKGSFIIGYFDGDGSVSLPKPKIKRKTNVLYPSYSIIVSIRGTIDFLQSIVDSLKLENSKLYFSKTWVLNISNKSDILKFFKSYDNLPFYLKRKYDKFQERINHKSFVKILQAQTISQP